MTMSWKCFVSVLGILMGLTLLPPSLALAATPVSCGQVLTDSIDAAGEKNQYSLYLTAGSRVSIRAGKTGGAFTPYLELYAPDGARLAVAAGQIDRTVTTAGTYVVAVHDDNMLESGTYTFTWQKLNGPCAAIGLTCGQSVTGSIGRDDVIPPWRVYTFPLTSGDRLSVRVTATGGDGGFTPYMEFYAPDGTLVTAASGQIDRAITATGTYTVIVRDDNTSESGNYTLMWQKMKGTCGATNLACGQPDTGSIGRDDAVPPWKFYNLSFTAGDQVSIRIIKTGGDYNFTPYLELYGPYGTLIIAASGQIDRTITTTGTYTVVVRDDNTSESGNYTLMWQKLKGTCGASSLSCGQANAGSIGRDDALPPWRFYTLAFTAGDQVSIRTTKTWGDYNFTPYLELYSPDGIQLAAASSQLDRTITTTGTYLVIVRDDNASESGTYDIIWQKVNGPCGASGLACGKPVTGSIGRDDTMPPWRFYTLSFTAGDQVSIRAIKKGGDYSFTPYIELYSPDGIQLAAASSQLDRTITVSGIYMVMVRDDNTSESGNYTLMWQKLNGACATIALPCGRLVTGSIGRDATTPPWRFYALPFAVDDQISIRATRKGGDGSFIPYIELYSPDGIQLAAASGQIDRTITVTGTYMMILRDDDAAQSGTYDLVWQKLNGTCSASALACGQSVTGSIGRDATTPPWRFYSLSFAAGDQVSIRTVKTGGDYSFNPYLELYSPDGIQLAAASGQIDRTVTTTGTYMVIIRDDDTAQSGSYVLYWQKWNSLCNARTIGCGQTLRGSTGYAGELDFYAFTAASGDTVAIKMTNLSGGLDPSIALYDKIGTSLASAYSTSGGSATITNTVTSSGNYLIVASDYGNDETGQYTLKLQKNGDSCPEVTVTSPNGGEILQAGSAVTIGWTSVGKNGITAQDISLSADGGSTYPTVVAKGLAGSVRSYAWSIPSTMKSANARIRVTATDGSGNSVSDDSDDDFVLLQKVNKALRTYRYDKLNRLSMIINENGTEITYTYDGVGNRLTLGGGVGAYIVTGTVKDAKGAGISGVTMTLAGSASRTATTNAAGAYVFTAVANGTYTLIPGKSGVTFTPARRAVTVSGGNMPGQDFTGAP